MTNKWAWNPYGQALNIVISTALGNTPDPLFKTIKYVDPLILDLNGNGLDITALNASTPVLFDADGDAVRTGTAWAGANDGFLVLDRNGNGTIDNGGELFGDQTVLADGSKATQGFAALAGLDANQDGVFDGKDAQFGNVRVWQDANQDGVSQAGEMKSLTERGIASINLASTASSKRYGDALLVRDGSFTRTDGSVGEVGSFILAQNNFVRSFVPVAVSDAAKALPSIQGSGWVRDLQEAATQSPELIGLLIDAQNAPTRAAFKDDVGKLLRAWGNDSAYNSASKQALAAGYGLIQSVPLDVQERDWMDVAVKASQTDRDAFRATLADAERTKFDAMRERMVGGLENIYAYEAFTGYTFLNWSKILSDANYIPPSVAGGGGGGASGGYPVEVNMPFSQILADHRYAAMASQPGYILINIPSPPAGTPHATALWNRLVDDASANMLPALRLTQVSGDAIADEKRGLIYAARVKMERASMDIDGKTIALAPGMAATVEIKTGRRRVAEYFLSPLLQYKHDSLRER